MQEILSLEEDGLRILQAVLIMEVLAIAMPIERVTIGL